MSLRGHTGILRWLDRKRFPEAAGPDDHWLREELNRAVGAYLESLGPSKLRAAEISGGGAAWRYPDLREGTPYVTLPAMP